MKNYTKFGLLLMFAAIIGTSSCEPKDEEKNIDCYPVTIVSQFSDEPGAIYKTEISYTDDMLMQKWLEYDGYFETYEFDDSHKMLKINRYDNENFKYIYIEFTYDESGNIEKASYQGHESLFEKKISAKHTGVLSTKLGKLFEQAPKLKSSKAENEDGFYEYAWEIYETNNDGNLKQITFYNYDGTSDGYNTFEYDEKGNQTKYSMYYIEDGEAVLDFEISISYDEKNHPFSNLNLPAYYEESFVNNPLTYEPEGLFSFEYEYNKYDYPTVVTTSDDDVIEYKYEMVED